MLSSCCERIYITRVSVSFREGGAQSPRNQNLPPLPKQKRRSIVAKDSTLAVGMVTCSACTVLPRWLASECDCSYCTSYCTQCSV